jgi:ABC-type Mn2+/Zn2+ transport system ATPase subunit
MEDAVVLEEAMVAFRHSVALQGVSLRIKSGEFVGVVGPNGAGKTTLLTVINGLTRLTSGRCRVLGRDLPAQGGRSLRKLVGYVPQAERIDPRMPMSVLDEVMVGRFGVLGPLRGPSKADFDVAKNSLELVGMQSLAGRPVGHLSGGEHQRVSIARCLAQKPQLFLLDEPTASLDWKGQSEILEIVRRIHIEGHMTTLYVTHDMESLPHACDRVVLMKAGRIVGDGAPEAIVSTASLSRLYDLPEEAVSSRKPHVHSEEHSDPGKAR